MKDPLRIIAILVILFAGFFFYKSGEAARLNNQAVDLINQKKYPQAIEVLKSARAQHPENLTILKNLAKIYYEIKEMENATEAYETILRLDPSNAEAQERLDLIRNPDLKQE